jgi:hypothetical protein
VNDTPARCVACGGTDFTAPRDIHGYVPATFGWFGDPLVGFACSACGFVHLYRKPRRKVSDRMAGSKRQDDDDAGPDGPGEEAP